MGQILTLCHTCGRAPGDTFTISLDGTDIQVTSNLFTAIKQLRDRPDLTREANSLDGPAFTGTDARQPATAWKSHRVNYWIDAICIDQSNVKEKNIQVPKMKQLYSTATKVVIWLGDPTDLRPDLNEQSITTALAAGDEAFRSICEAGHNSVTMFDVLAATRLKILTDVMEDPSQLVESTVDIIVLSLKWNSRIWTLQEAVWARDDPIVIVGKNVTTLLRLAWLQYCLFSCAECQGPLERHVSHPYEHVIHVLDFRALALYAGHLSIRDQLSPKPRQNRGGRFRCLATNLVRRSPEGTLNNDQAYNESTAFFEFAHELLHCFCAFSNREATVPHDRLYGLLGLRGTVAIPKLLQPDYSHPAGEVFFAYAKWIIQTTRRIHVISFGQNELAGYPSWVPNFTGGANLAKASTEYQISPSISPVSGCLSVSGVKRGEVVACHFHKYIPPVEEDAIPSSAFILDTWSKFELSIMLPASQILGRDGDKVP